jgi:hypothetical protein
VLFVLVIAVALDGLTRSGHHAGGSQPGVAGRPVVSPSRQLPVRSGPADTPRSVLYRFASAYSQVSRASAAQRYRLLLALAAPPLLSQMRAVGPQGALTPTSALLRRASLDSLLLNLRVATPTGGTVQGSVVVEQWLVGPGDSKAPPTSESYKADLIKVGGDWRVSNFGLAP